MGKIAYVNGAYLPHDRASIHIEDRSVQFADSIYEVVACINGKLADERGHLDRLERSLKALKIAMPVSREALQIIMRHIIRVNKFKSAAIYIQISRGSAKRDFKMPRAGDAQPALIVYGWAFDFTLKPEHLNGLSVQSTLDQRWARRDIKTTQLLAQSLIKQNAIDAGYNDAWMLDENGYVNEASSSNVWILKGRSLYTRNADKNILKGVTRTAIASVVEALQLNVEESTFTPAEAQAADEAFQSSATSLVVPVTSVDGKPVGNGKVGNVTQQILQTYIDYVNAGEPIAWTE
ncbi:MAG: aminotransferase class IV [Alphaproteobacteria bacterium]